MKPIIKFRISCGRVWLHATSRPLTAWRDTQPSIINYPWLLRLSPELGSCGKVEVNVLGFPYLMTEWMKNYIWRIKKLPHKTCVFTAPDTHSAYKLKLPKDIHTSKVQTAPYPPTPSRKCSQVRTVSVDVKQHWREDWRGCPISR